MFKKMLSLAIMLTLSTVAVANDEKMMLPPTVLKLRAIDTYSPRANDPYLMGLSTNYKSYAEYQTFMVGNTRSGEYFAQKAIATYSGQRVEPENPAKWKINKQYFFALQQGYDQLQFLLRRNAADCYPIETAEAQSKFDCWVDQTAVQGPENQREECRRRFYAAINTLNDYFDLNGRKRTCVKESMKKGSRIMPLKDKTAPTVSTPDVKAWPDTSHLIYMNNLGWRAERPITVLHKIEMPCCGRMMMQDNRSMPMDNNAVTREEFDALKADVDQLKRDVADLKAQFAQLNQGEKGDSISLVIEQAGEQVETFELFFNFDKSNVKTKYNDVLQQVVALAKEQDVSLLITGYTDRMGTKKYNEKLGLRRANAVKKFLVDAGVPSSALTVVSKGEMDNKVPTKDGKAHPQNRRVVITASCNDENRNPDEECVE